MVVCRPRPRYPAGARSILTAIVITSVLVIVIGVPFTLWWWRIADKWADAEHRRFKTPIDDRERITVAGPTPRGDGEPGPADGPRVGRDAAASGAAR